MRRMIVVCSLFIAGVLIWSASNEIIHAQGAQYETKKIAQTDLGNIPGQEVLIFTSTWQPGFRLPLHMHPNGHEFTFVIEVSYVQAAFVVVGNCIQIVKSVRSSRGRTGSPFSIAAMSRIVARGAIRGRARDGRQGGNVQAPGRHRRHPVVYLSPKEP
jgi:hypothetical protein